MRRSTARGRVFPQSYSTDRRYGRLSIKACALFPLMWANADDQGRLTGEVEEVKYAVCPNIDHIAKADIPELLEELDKNDLIKLYNYNSSNAQAIQMLDWWEVHKPQWAWPSQYPPPEGWQDRLRYKKSTKEVVTLNWFSGERSPENSPERSPEPLEISPLTTHVETETETETLIGIGRSPEPSGERSGEDSSPPQTTFQDYISRFTNGHERAFGKLPNARETAQLRDLAKELSTAGCPLNSIDEAFREAATHNKFSISYVRAVLFDWLGLERGPP